MKKSIYIESIHKENFIEAVDMMNYIYDEEITVTVENEKLLTVSKELNERFEGLAYNPNENVKADELIRVEFGF